MVKHQKQNLDMFLTVALENLFLVKIFDKIHLIIVVVFVVVLYLQPLDHQALLFLLETLHQLNH
jgi:hypothetical protein